MAERISAVLIGEGTLLVQCADALLQRGHTIAAVVSTDRTIAQWSDARAIERLAHVDEVATIARRQAFDYIFSIANLTMIPSAVLALARRGGVNFHDGPLPRYAGLYATSWALLHGEPTHGVTWHEMLAGADTGRILAQRTFDVPMNETAFTLNARCYEAGLGAFGELLDAIEQGTLTPTDQDASARTYFGRRKRPAAAGSIDWQQPADRIDALVRALDFGPYANPLTVPKLLLPGGPVAVTHVQVTSARSTADAGTVVTLDAGAMRVATTTTDLELRRFATLEGQPLELDGLALQRSVRVGEALPALDTSVRDRLTALHQAVCTSEAFWTDRLASLEPTASPLSTDRTDTPRVPASRTVTFDETLRTALAARGIDPRVFTLGAWATYVGMLSGADRVELGFTTSSLRRDLEGLSAYFASEVPVRLSSAPSQSGADVLAALSVELSDVERHRTFVRDLPARVPALAARLDLRQPLRFPLVAAWDDDLAQPQDISADLALRVSADGSQAVLVFDSSAVSAAAVGNLADGFLSFAAAMAEAPDRLLRDLPLVSRTELARALDAAKAAEAPVDTTHCVHQLFEAQVERTPDAVAVVCRGQALTYRELNRRANQLAHHLRGLGVGPDALVGLCLERSTNMLVGLLGILKAGGAYVPLDPEYPTDRLAVMLDDSNARVLVTEKRLRASLPTTAADVVELDGHWGAIAKQPDDNPASGVAPEHLAYVIFTSGSTGRPKGVMVAHRNVVNFFAGMDTTLGTRAGTWLAVTSISFDISVQELFWPLAHGFTVVVYTGDDRTAGPAAAPRSGATRPVDFSLFYFASDAGAQGREKYKLLLEGARFADQHGFSAVWSPERHFHAFGGLYPNPSVTSAALAAITSRVKIRAGSVVLPLHMPLRVAEEWSLVDNLSSGRVGIAFAAGWQSNDFVLRPENYADRKNIMMRDIDVVRRLWRGEAVAFAGADGQLVETRIMPRPVQRELPFWLTVAGNPETFRMAGTAGANLLTHLLGQTLEEVAAKIRIYREAWKAAGHPGEGYVTLMLHTFVGEDTDAVREIVRKPFSDYLRTAVDLVRHAPEQFPTHKAPTAAQAAQLAKGMQQVSEEDLEALLEFAFDRYFETSGLLGSVERCLEIVESVRQIGTDEIGCLIDYGVHPALVLPSLRHLNTVRERSQAEAAPPMLDESVAGLIARYHVTHLQCTPSMGRMLVSDTDSQRALGALHTLLLGGEALPPALADQVALHVRGDIHNMYGPTETTIWSTTAPIVGRGAPVTIGRPLVNQQVHIMNAHGQALPAGVAGELCIGGAGVVRGYLDRPELTAERFVRSPLAGVHGRLYRTGDLARLRDDGAIEFLGRIDHQIKIRGYRVELGEIEATLASHPQVAEAVVLAREDVPGDLRLVAYIVARAGRTAQPSELRSLVESRLPDFMVPSMFVVLDAMPLTPNGKINRRALPAPERARQDATSYVAPANELEQTIATIFAEALNVEHVGAQDNFFDLGAHSLLMVQVHGRLQESLGRKLSLIQLFRFPTVSTLAAHLGADSGDDDESLQRSSERADRRRDLLARRQQQRRQMART